MKKLLLKSGLATLATIMLLTQPIAADAKDVITVTIDGTVQQYAQPPVVQDGRTLVPMRSIFESLGASVHWNQQEQKITAIKDGKEILLTIGEKRAYVDHLMLELDIPAQIINDRTLVPIRFIAESLDNNVDWDPVNKRVSIIEKAKTKTAPVIDEEKKQIAESIPKEKKSIFQHGISIGAPGTIAIEHILPNLDDLVLVGNGGDNIIRLSGEGILYIDRDHTNNPGYNAGFDIFLGEIKVVSNLQENGVAINVTIDNNEIKKVGPTSFSSNTKGTISVGLILRGETEVFDQTTIKVDIP